MCCDGDRARIKLEGLSETAVFFSLKKLLRNNMKTAVLHLLNVEVRLFQCLNMILTLHLILFLMNLVQYKDRKQLH